MIDGNLCVSMKASEIFIKVNQTIVLQCQKGSLMTKEYGKLNVPEFMAILSQFRSKAMVIDFQ
jgi:hypothetical protein